jgi:hypothetical protein
LKLIVRVRKYHILINIYKKNCWFENWIFKNIFLKIHKSQTDYSSRNRQDWYKVLYQRTMYVISLSNISIKTNFKQITRVKLKCVQSSEGHYISCMTSRYICQSFNDVTSLCFLSHSNNMTSYPRLEKYNNFWLVKTPGIKNPYYRVFLGHIIYRV